MSLEFTWEHAWKFCERMSQENRHEFFRLAAHAIITITGEEQIKALEGAPEDFVNGIEPYLKVRLKPQSSIPITQEDWDAAEKRWNEIKESK